MLRIFDQHSSFRFVYGITLTLKDVYTVSIRAHESASKQVQLTLQGWNAERVARMLGTSLVMIEHARDTASFSRSSAANERARRSDRLAD